MKKIFIFFVAGLIFYSCNNSSNSSSGTKTTKDPNKIEISNDFENALSLIPSWVNEKTIVKMENGQPHSGEYVSKVDDVNIFSYAYREYFMNINNNKLPKAVYVNGWVNSPSPSDKLSIILDIGDNNAPTLWKCYNLASLVTESNKWFEYTASFAIDKPIKSDNLVKIYGYSGGKLTYFDDFKVTFIY